MIHKIAACDDSSVVLRQMAGYFEGFQNDTGIELAPAYFSSGEELLKHISDDTELLFLDISMGGMNGIECALQLRAQGRDLPIVFITSMIEYALDGYAVHAFGFLPKPVTYGTFADITREALSKMVPAKPKTILVNTTSGVNAVDPAELLYAEVYQHETSFVLPNRKIKGNVQLAAVENMLTEHGFFRCHKSFLVSLEQISFIGSNYLTVKNGDTVPLSKHRRKEFLDAYSSYMGVRFT